MSQAEDNKKRNSWAAVKEYIKNRAKIIHIKDGEILWCAVGENIGVEINGKNSNYERPVLVFRKISKYGFIGIPLTSQKKDGHWYVHFKHRDKDQYAALTQVRFMSTYRVYRRMGQIDDADYAIVAKGLQDILFPDNKNISSLTTGGLGREYPDYGSIIPNQTTNVNSKNTSSLTTGVCGRENPKSESIVPPRLPLVKRLFQKIQKIFRQKNHQRGKK